MGAFCPSLKCWIDYKGLPMKTESTKKPQKKSIKQRAKKAVVTQDNRFVYAKYDMNANELKFFMWIVAQINSQRDTLFQECEIPLSEVFQIFNHQNDENHTYVRNLCSSMSKKTYEEDFVLNIKEIALFDDDLPLTEGEIFLTMPLFKYIAYVKGEQKIRYKLNDSLMKYFLNLKRDFTQFKFDDIQRMKSAYSIRIYNMLICELKQNRQSLKINLATLQNILEVPKTLQEYKHFNQKVLTQARNDINAKSNLVLLDIKTYKTGRAITDLEFIFDYKNYDKRIQRDEEKKKSFNKALIEAIDRFIGKSVYFGEKIGELVCEGHKWEDKEETKLLARFRRLSDDKAFITPIREFKDLNALQKAKNKAEELFYTDINRIQQVFDFKKLYKPIG